MRHDFQLDGRAISYLDVAPPAARHLGTVLLLHAFPLAAEMWRPQLAGVTSGWRFIAPDFRGFGASAPDTRPAPDRGRQAAGHGYDVSIDDYARDALALLDHLRLGDAVVCGLSMGGYAAFAMYRLAPGRVRGLLLADTRPDVDSPAGRAAREQMLQALPRDGVAAVAEAMVPRLLGATSLASRPSVVDHVRRLAASQSPEAIAPAIVRLMTRPDSTPLLSAIRRPVLVVAGEEDEIAGPDIARQMHGQIAGAGLALIGRAGHLSNLEQPEAFNEALDRFLATSFLGG
jgi:pimeloyl-ACP methyl ester carboxylesterase